MEDSNQQNTDDLRTAPTLGNGQKKVIQPTQAILEEVKNSETGTVQPMTVIQNVQAPSSAAQNQAAGTPPLAPAQAIQASNSTNQASTRTPVTPDLGNNFPATPIANQITSNKTIDAALLQSSATIFSRVSLLRTFIFIGVGLATLQLLILFAFRGRILGTLTLFSLTTQGSYNSLLTLLAYGAQISIILNMLLFLALTLSKSFKAVHLILTVTIIFNILSGLVNLLSGNITGIIFTVIIIWFIRNVSDDVSLEEYKQTAT